MSAPESSIVDIVQRLTRAVPLWIAKRTTLLSLELRINVRRLALVVALGALTGCLLFSAWVAACALVLMALVGMGVPWYSALLGFVIAFAALAVASIWLAVRLLSAVRFSPLLPSSEHNPP